MVKISWKKNKHKYIWKLQKVKQSCIISCYLLNQCTLHDQINYVIYFFNFKRYETILNVRFNLTLNEIDIKVYIHHIRVHRARRQVLWDQGGQQSVRRKKKETVHFYIYWHTSCFRDLVANQFIITFFLFSCFLLPWNNFILPQIKKNIKLVWRECNARLDCLYVYENPFSCWDLLSLNKRFILEWIDNLHFLQEFLVHHVLRLYRVLLSHP